MQNVLVLGGGVGGTLVANLISRKIKKQIDAGEARVTVVDATGEHLYQPGYMYIAMGNQDPKSLRKPERRLLDDRVDLVIGTITKIDEESRQVELADGTKLDYDELILSLGSRILPETIEHFEEEAHHFYSEEAAAKLRKALDSFTGGKVVVGIASMPYKCPPAPLEVVFLIEAELRERGLRDKSELHYCSPIARAFTIESVSEMATPELENKGIELHTFAVDRQYAVISRRVHLFDRNPVVTALELACKVADIGIGDELHRHQAQRKTAQQYGNGLVHRYRFLFARHRAGWHDAFYAA